MCYASFCKCQFKIIALSYFSTREGEGDSRGYRSAEEQARELARAIRREVAKLADKWNALVDASDVWGRCLEDAAQVSGSLPPPRPPLSLGMKLETRQHKKRVHLIARDLKSTGSAFFSYPLSIQMRSGYLPTEDIVWNPIEELYNGIYPSLALLTFDPYQAMDAACTTRIDRNGRAYKVVTILGFRLDNEDETLLRTVFVNVVCYHRRDCLVAVYW
ncbi:hypothetical protein EVAR_31638_1 [Eumeta japonica]|uniref:Uncharacterized protein n=1 Tax=Eumeta variegata TaxID=151549 RepID=A0A4C1W1Z0_EUMVA|nr:hypothetical protein EVAR_31638_1 [Eumeta japonica]